MSISINTLPVLVPRVIPAQAESRRQAPWDWMPSYAGMTFYWRRTYRNRHVVIERADTTKRERIQAIKTKEDEMASRELFMLWVVVLRVGGAERFGSPLGMLALGLGAAMAQPFNSGSTGRTARWTFLEHRLGR